MHFSWPVRGIQVVEIVESFCPTLTNAGGKLCPLFTLTYIRMHWSGEWRLYPISTDCTEAVHSQNSHLYASDFSLLSLLSTLKWGEWGQAILVRGNEEKLWVILCGKLNQALVRQLELGLAQGGESQLLLLFCPSDAGTHVLLKDILSVLCRGGFSCMLQWKCQLSCSGCLWQMNSHRWDRAAQPLC